MGVCVPRGAWDGARGLTVDAGACAGDGRAHGHAREQMRARALDIAAHDSPRTNGGVAAIPIPLQARRSKTQGQTMQSPGCRGSPGQSS